MRARIANYTAEKFSHNYHRWNLIAMPVNSTTRRSRQKRDGGLVSGPIATAVVTGNDRPNRVRADQFHPSQSEGGCTWFGTAPLCNWPCPSEYDFIRMHNGRCSNMWFSGFCVLTIASENRVQQFLEATSISVSAA
ncbi:hypothetical protein OSTOST_24936, partial [Ostertagia ostertagi]